MLCRVVAIRCREVAIKCRVQEVAMRFRTEESDHKVHSTRRPKITGGDHGVQDTER